MTMLSVQWSFVVLIGSLLLATGILGFAKFRWWPLRLIALLVFALGTILDAFVVWAFVVIRLHHHH
jgi:multisubunit Na+/H+ antiporter MnhG subunit